MNADTGLHGIERRLYERVQEIVTQIETAKAQIAAVRPHEISGRDIRAVAGQLDAVGREAELAASSFLDAAEQLGILANQLPEGPSGELQKIATQIFEASNFHDITGQRLTKALGVLAHIESKLTALSDVLHDGALAVPREDSPVVESDSVEPPLDGPNPDHNANLQDDIDALFDNLK
jgi:chemotaxis protein CheZ